MRFSGPNARRRFQSRTRRLGDSIGPLTRLLGRRIQQCDHPNGIRASRGEGWNGPPRPACRAQSSSLLAVRSCSILRTFRDDFRTRGA
jgi:hypothetical protein